MKTTLFLLLSFLPSLLFAQTTFPSPGQENCNSTTTTLGARTAPDGVTLTPYRWVTQPCIDQDLATFSINDCYRRPPYNIIYPQCNTNGAYLRKPTFCYNNGYFPTTSGYPLAIAQNLTANSGNCQNGASHSVMNFSSVAARPIGLTFTVNDIDNPYDSVQVLVYSNGSLVDYNFAYGNSDPNLSFVKNSLNTSSSGSGNNISFNSKNWFDAHGWAANPVDTGYAKGAVNFTVDPTKYIDSIVVVHTMINNRPDANPAFSIGNFIWTSNSVLPVVYGEITADKTSNALVINWSTLSETDCDHFTIEASNDGTNFKPVKTIQSKAPNGTTTGTTNYSVSIDKNNWMGLLSISIFSIGFILLITTNKRNKFSVMCLIAGIAMFYTSCSKDDSHTNTENTKITFIRIAQYDKSSTVPKYSKTITVINQ